MEDIKNNKRNDKALAEDPIWKTFDALPDSIKDVLVSAEFESTIESIAKQHEVVEKLPDLLRKSEEVLLGMLPIQQFIKTLTESVDLSPEKAQRVGYAIRERIFADVADDLSRLHKVRGHSS